MDIICKHCAKAIKGKMVLRSVSNIERALGHGNESYHPRCHVQSEKAAARKLGIPFQYVAPT
jgi:thymidine kinase